MKILLITGTFPKLSETFVFDQVVGLLGERIDLTVLSLSQSTGIVQGSAPGCNINNKVISAGIPISYIGILWALPKALFKAIQYHSPKCIFQLVSLRKKIRSVDSVQLIFLLAALPKIDYEIIYCHFGHIGVLAGLLKELGFRGKVVTVFHGSDMSAQKKWNTDTYSNLFRAGDLFLPVSEHWRDKLIAAGCPAEKTFTQHLGVKIDLFSFRSREFPTNRPVKYITVGRLVPKKGHSVVLDALAMLRSRGHDFRYSIVGSGRLKGALKKQARKLGLADVVTFEGQKDHATVAKLMQSSDVFVLASHTAADGDSEGIPVVLMETLSLGLPTVSTYHSGIPELIQDRVNGVLAKEDSAESLADSLEWLNKNSNEWRSLEHNGRQMIEQNYNASKQIRKLYFLLRKEAQDFKLHR